MDLRPQQPSPQSPMPFPPAPPPRAVEVAADAAAIARPALPKAPPLFLFRMVVAFRNWLVRLTRALVPAPIAIYEMVTGFWFTEMVHTAARLRLADLLADGPKTAAELALLARVDTDALARLMRALVSLGVFERDGQQRFRNNRLAEPLRSEGEGSIRDLILYGASDHSMRAWRRFEDVIRTGKNGYELEHGKALFDYLADHPEEGTTFNKAMVGWTGLEVPALARGYDYSQFGSLCDVAGGRGQLLGAILSLNPKMKGVLFDEARVIDEADPMLSAWGVRDRVTPVGGNMFESVPGGCEAYILKDILHDWDDEKSRQILTSCRKAMTKGTKLLVIEMVVVDDDKFHPVKLLDLHMMTAIHDGKQRSEAEFARLFAETGFALRRIVPLATTSSVIEAEAV